MDKMTYDAIIIKQKYIDKIMEVIFSDLLCHTTSAFVKKINDTGIVSLLEYYIEKYLSISSEDVVKFIAAGTTCACFKIGDYAFKLIDSKWSYEDEICPDLFLVSKCFEKDYIRSKDGHVLCGIEVQKYLYNDVENVDDRYISYFKKELNNQGYFTTDTLTGGVYGENIMLLNDYNDADIMNPNELPEWFKKAPIVLVDRDRVYPTCITNIKQDMKRDKSSFLNQERVRSLHSFNLNV